jgi:hypothetical protein
MRMKTKMGMLMRRRRRMRMGMRMKTKNENEDEFGGAWLLENKNGHMRFMFENTASVGMQCWQTSDACG